MAETNVTQTVDTLLQGMEEFITTKTVVGEAIHVGDTIIVPLMDVTFGIAATSKNEPSRRGGGGGMGGKMTPSAVLVIKNGSTRVINVKSQDGFGKLLDMVPDLMNRFNGNKKGQDPEVDRVVKDVAGKEESF